MYDYKYCSAYFPWYTGPNPPVVRIQSQLLHLTDNLPDNLSALRELPCTLEQSCAASAHTTTVEEEETEEISGLDEDLQRYQFIQLPSLSPIYLSTNPF